MTHDTENTSLYEAVELTEDQFEERYTQVPNHLNPHAAWVTGDGPGNLFETYGDEVDFVYAQDPAKVWTLIDGNDGDLYLISGRWFVNRIGHLITEEAVPVRGSVSVHIPMGRDSEEDA